MLRCKLRMRELRFAIFAIGLAIALPCTVGCKSPSPERGEKPRTPRFQNPFQRKKAEPPPRALPASVFGEIRQVNAEGKFALVDTGSAVAAQPGEILLAIQDGRVTGELRLTELKSPPFLIADILSGQPAARQKVYRRD